jgi:hypothetical protein
VLVDLLLLVVKLGTPTEVEVVKAVVRLPWDANITDNSQEDLIVLFLQEVSLNVYVGFKTSKLKVSLGIMNYFLKLFHDRVFAHDVCKIPTSFVATDDWLE